MLPYLDIQVNEQLSTCIHFRSGVIELTSQCVSSPQVYVLSALGILLKIAVEAFKTILR